MIKIIESSKEKLTFIVSDINNTIANAIRRSISEIPIIAIDEVEFIKNDSALYDEILAHRLGLVPLQHVKLTPRKECRCEGKGCSSCMITLKLSATGPCTVYAEQLKGKVKPVYNKMPLVILEKDQELQFNAYVRAGTATEHAKFSPGILYYIPFPIIKELKEIKEKEKSKIVRVSKEIFEAIKAGEDIRKDFLGEIVEHEKKFLAIEPSSKDFIFTIESFGQLSPKQIFISAINALENNLEELNKKIEKIK